MVEISLLRIVAMLVIFDFVKPKFFLHTKNMRKKTHAKYWDYPACPLIKGPGRDLASQNLIKVTFLVSFILPDGFELLISEMPIAVHQDSSFLDMRLHQAITLFPNVRQIQKSKPAPGKTISI